MRCEHSSGRRLLMLLRSRSRYSNPTEHVITTVREACMSVPSVRPSEGSPCRTPPALPLSDSPLHPRPLAHGTPHARAASTARAHLSSPRPLSQPPRATFLIDLLLVCCRAECARRLVPIWIRRDLGGRLPPPPRLLGSSRCAPSTEPQCVPFAPCRRNGVPRPSPPAQDVSKRRALRTPAWRMPY